MGKIQKAFSKELAKTPRRLLLKLINEKLSAEGLTDKPGLAEALADHCLNGGGDILQWDDGGPSDNSSQVLELYFSERDSARLTEITEEFIQRLPAMIQNITEETAENVLQTLERNWPEQSAYETAVFDGFRDRLEARWGEAFDLLRILLASCRELGESSAKRIQRSKARKNRFLRSLILRLHARACQITAEIIVLMESGFADGAMARWRTLYEVEVVATVIADAGESLAKCYIEHEAIELKLALDEYERCNAAIGFKPVPSRERRRIERAFAAAVKAHGNDFGKPYGWAATHLNKKRVMFRDLENAANRSAMRSHYKMASYNVHSDTPRSIFCRLGVIGDQSIIISGATDAGFTEPGQNAAFTLVQITALLLADRPSDLDIMIQQRVLTIIRDRVPDAFMRAERKLKRDYAKQT